MRASSALCLALASSLLPLTALAQDSLPVQLPVPPMQLEPGKMLTVAGVRGRWWPLQTAVQLADEHLAMREMQELLAAHEALERVLRERIVEKDERITRWQLAHGLTEARAVVAEQAIEAAVRGRSTAEARVTEAEARLHVWYRHPALWFSLGAVVTVAAAGASFALVN